MPQRLYTDFGAYGNRVVPIPIYATNSPEQIEYIISDAKIRTLLMGEQLQYNNAFKVRKDSKYLGRLVVFGPAIKMNPEGRTPIYFGDSLRLGNNAHAGSTMKIRMTKAIPEDLATIIHTSGATGGSKGVMLPHSHCLETMRAHDVHLPLVTDKDLSTSFLPITHIFEKAWCYYRLHKGVTIAINQDLKMIQKILPEVHPASMYNVPRFQEKVYAGVHEEVNSISPAMKKIFLDVIEIGRKYNLEYENEDIPTPCGLKLKFQFYSKTVFTLLKRVSDIEHGWSFPAVSASLSDTVSEFLQSVNAPIAYGYGLSKMTVTVCSYPKIEFQFGSIGEVMPGARVRVDPGNNEILVKGRTAISEYYNKSEEMERTLIEDDFFRTGDAGRLEGNTLFLAERIKGLYEISNGKYIVPQTVEMVMGGDNYIERITVISDQRKFVSALTVPAYPSLEKYAEEKGISFGSWEELVKNEDIIRFIETRIEEHQKNLTSYRKIKHFTLLPEPSMMGCGLTDTLRLRRPVVLQKYTTEIEMMYEE